MKKFLALTIATWFGSGLIPPPKFLRGMAGTYGSIAALPLCVFFISQARQLSTLSNYQVNDSWVAYIIWIVAIGLIGATTISLAEKTLGPKTDWQGKTKNHDQNQIVIDEVFGMLCTCLPLTWMTVNNWWLAFALALVYFRFFDIVKIWPAKIFDRSHDPFGVMLDDVVAGIYAGFLLGVTIRIFAI